MKTTNATLLTSLVISLSGATLALAEDKSATASVAAAEQRAEHAEQLTEARKAALDMIDAQIDVIDASLASAPTEVDRSNAKARLDSLKERRSELRKAYVQAKYDELKADINAEYEHVAAWTKRTASNIKDRFATTEPGSVAAANAEASTGARRATVDLPLYHLNPSPENKDDVKQALKALDKEIDRLEDKADDLPKGEVRAAMKERVKSLETRYKDLKRNFTKEQWTSLVEDVRKTWEALIG